MASHPDHPAAYHPLPQRDLQWQENRHERQDGGISSLGNEKEKTRSEDGGRIGRDTYMAPKWPTSTFHDGDFKSDSKSDITPRYLEHRRILASDSVQPLLVRRRNWAMAILSAASLFILLRILLVTLWPASHVQAVPRPQEDDPSATANDYWLASISRNGRVPYGDPSHQIYRNVRDFGARGDGSADDTDAINRAVSSGNRCGNGCDSSTTTPAIVYFPPGTYRVRKPIIQYYYSQFVGNPHSLPVIKATPDFEGIAVIDSDPYIPGGDGAQWYTNQNNFFRQVRNFVIDVTEMPLSRGAGIHWQVAQATSLQNIRFEMRRGGGSENNQQGIFMDNGSGGLMTDLVFNGGKFGAFFGNQQFTTRNLTFNDCQTAIYMNWNWLWTLKSVNINNCPIGIDMSSNPSDQAVGSVMLLDSKFTNTATAVKTAFSGNSVPLTGGTLVVDNVDFRGARVAVQDTAGKTVLAGGQIVKSWVQGSVYQPSKGSNRVAKRHPQDPNHSSPCPAPSTQTVILVPSWQATAVGGDTATLVAVPDKVASVSASLAASAIMSDSPSVLLSSEAGAANTEAVDKDPVASGETLSNTSPSSSSLSNPSMMADPTTIVPPVSTESNVSVGSAVLGTAVGSSLGNALPIPTLAAPFGNETQYNITDQSCTGPPSPKSRRRVQQSMDGPSKPASLLRGNKVFERSKPQYENVPLSAFISVKSRGAKGDGRTDDTAAVQRVINEARTDQIVYFDHGAYVITNTINVPKNIRITGEIWPLIMASGQAFSDERRPKPVFRVGSPGDRGRVEMTDLMFQTLGPAPGAILMEWNVAESSQGSCALWDVHFRIGGTAGTRLQIDKCQKNEKQPTAFNPECAGAFMLMHITKQASAYLENTWFWVADHELDLSSWPGYKINNQINIYNGRGILVESQGPVWMYGTSSEHSVFYNYQIHNAKDIWMGAVQTETAYMQSNPNALQSGFSPNPAYADPDFASCTSDACRKTWGLRVLGSKEVYLYGGGMYSFFENYNQQCLDTESCQENMVDIQCSSDVWLYGLSTKASINMVTVNNRSQAIALENDNNFCQTVALFEEQ